MVGVNFKKTYQIRPFLDKDEVNKRFFINRCKGDSELLEHLQKEKTDFYEETIKSSSHPLIRLPYFYREAKKIIWSGLNDGFNFFSDHTRLNELYPPYKTIDEKKIPRDVRNVCYYSIFTTMVVTGVILGLVITSTTGVLSLLQGSLIGLGVGLTLGSITGHVLCNKAHKIYEELYSQGFKKGGSLVTIGISDNTKILDDVMKDVYGEKDKFIESDLPQTPYAYPQNLYFGDLPFYNQMNTGFYPTVRSPFYPYNCINSSTTYMETAQESEQKDAESNTSWGTRIAENIANKNSYGINI